MRKLTTLTTLTVLLLTGCGIQNDPVIELTINNELESNFMVEVADTPKERAKGLMGVSKLPKQSGMLFEFEDSKIRNFWMKNTLIPLDIIYINEKYEITEILRNVPPCKTDECPTYPSNQPAKFVLEINGNLSNKLKIEPGQKITL